jgi:hypothetical protein
MKILPRYTYDQFGRMTGRSRRTVQAWAMGHKIPGLGGGSITLAGVKDYFSMTTDELRELDIDIDDAVAASA